MKPGAIHRVNSNDCAASLVGICTQHDHHGSQLLSLVRGVVRTGRWARLSAGLEVNLLSSHAGRSGAPNGWQNTQQATPQVGTVMENQPARHHQHDTEPLWVGVGGPNGMGEHSLEVSLTCEAVMNPRSSFLPTTSPSSSDQIRAQQIPHGQRRRCSRYGLRCRWARCW